VITWMLDHFSDHQRTTTPKTKEHGNAQRKQFSKEIPGWNSETCYKHGINY